MFMPKDTLVRSIRNSVGILHVTGVFKQGVKRGK